MRRDKKNSNACMKMPDISFVMGNGAAACLRRASGAEMEQAARFWNRVAERYARQPVADEAAYQKKLEVTRGYFRPEMEVLEIGCGTGSTAILHAPYVKHIRAVDFSSKMLDIARRKAEAGDIRNITFIHCAIDAFSAPERTFDAVLGLSILHLLENKEEVISRVYRMLKPGGVFVTSTACIGDMAKIFKVIAPVGKFLGVLPLLQVFTATELKDSLTDAGFRIDYEWQPGKNKAVFIVAKKP